jgi:predicted transcriptional regulator
MSIELLCWAFKQELPCAEKFVLVALADMADMDGKCWPSQAFLAKRCGIARETVNRQIKMLANAGMIRVEQRVNGHGQQASLYFVRCDAGSQPNVIDAHTPVTDDHTEPSRNLKKEDSVGASAPTGASADPVAVLWQKGMAILGPKNRTLMGKLVSKHGKAAMLEAIAAVDRENPVDPLSYLLKCCARGGNDRSQERAYDILAQAAIDFDERQSRSGYPEAAD